MLRSVCIVGLDPGHPAGVAAVGASGLGAGRPLWNSCGIPAALAICGRGANSASGSAARLGWFLMSPMLPGLHFGVRVRSVLRVLLALLTLLSFGWQPPPRRGGGLPAGVAYQGLA